MGRKPVAIPIDQHPRWVGTAHHAEYRCSHSCIHVRTSSECAEFLVTGGGLGTALEALETDIDNLSATVADGLNLVETNGLAITAIASSVERTLLDATTVSVADAAQSDVLVSGDGHVLLTVSAGSLTIQDGNADSVGVTLAGNGNLRIDTGEDVVLQASVTVTDGAVTIVAGEDVSLEGTADLMVGNGSVRILATTGSITMADDLGVLTDAGNIRFTAAADITLGLLDARSAVDRAADTLTVQNVWGDISLEAGAVISDSSPADGAIDVYANALRMSAGLSIGALSPAFANAIETEVISVTAMTGGALDDDFINIVDASGLTVAQVDDVVVSEVATDGTTSDLAIGISQADVTTSAQGGIVLRALGGDLDITDGDGNGLGVVTGGLGNVLLDATGDIALGADVTSDGGDIRIEADGGVDQATGVDVLTTDATIDVEAFDGDITMADGAFASTGEGTGNIRYHASGTVTVGGLDAGSANVSVVADTGSILDAGDMTTDVAGFAFAASAALTIGTAVDPLETDIGVFAAEASDGIFIVEATDLVLDRVTALVDRVLPDGTTLPISDVSVVDVVTTGGGDILLRTLDGRIVLNDGDVNGVALSTSGAGNIRLQAVGEAQDIIVNADILAETGVVGLSAQNDVIFGADADLRTGGSVIDIEAVEGSILLADEALITSGGENIRAAALVDVLLGGIDAGTGNVSILTGLGSVLDAGDTYVDIIAENYRVTAGNTVGGIGGTTPDEIDTSVSVLTVAAESGIGIIDSDDITVGGVAVTVQRLAIDGTVSDIVDASQSDLVTGDNGSIVLRSSTGTITITDGDDTDGDGIDADGTGDITLDGIDVVLDATVTTGSGNISVNADADIDQNAGGDLTSGGGDIGVTAGGAITSDGSMTSSDGGDIRYGAGDDVVLAGIDADTGAVAVFSTEGSILDGGDTYIDVVASDLLLSAGDDIGELGADANAVDVAVDTLVATAAGDIHVMEADDVTISSVSVSVEHVDVDGSTSTVLESGSDLVAGGDVVLVVAGHLTVNDGDDNEIGIESGDDLLLIADALTLTVTVQSNANLSIQATGDILQSADGHLVTQGGSIDVVSGANLLMADGAQSISNGGDIRLQAEIDNVVGGVDTGTGDVALISSAGRIIDSGDIHVDVVGSGVLLQAAGDIGVTALEVNADTLAAESLGGDINISEIDDVVIGAVTVDVERVDAQTGETTTVTTMLNNIVTSGEGTVQLETGGALSMTDDAVVATEAGTIEITTVDEIELLTIMSGTGDITLVSGAAIVDISDDETANVVTEGQLSLDAVAGIGSTVEDLDIEVDRVTALNRMSGDIVLQETDGLTIDEGGLVNEGGGAIAVTVDTGEVVVDGAIMTVANGTIDVTATQEITINETITAVDGDVSVNGSEATLNSTVSTETGDISVSAAFGDVTMVDGMSLITTETGDVFLSATGDILLTQVSTTMGGISVESRNGSILDNSTSEDANLIAGGALTLNAAISIGSPEEGGSLNLNAGTVSLLGFNAENIAVKFEDGPEFIGSLEGLYAIVTKRDFEPWLQLTEQDTESWPRLDDVFISPDSDLLRAAADRVLMPAPFYVPLAGTELARSSEALALSMHLLMGDGQTLADAFNESLALALLDVELGLRFL